MLLLVLECWNKIWKKIFSLWSRLNVRSAYIRASLHESFRLSSRGDFRPGMNSSRYREEGVTASDLGPSENQATRHLVVFLLLFTRFRARTISSRDDFIPVLNTNMKCHPVMKRGENCLLNGLPGMKVPYVNSEMNSTQAVRLSFRDPRMKTPLENGEG